ncbi:Colicin V secretion protein CvaA [Sodalis praecaptivus]
MVNAGDSLVQILPRSIDDYFLVLWVPNEAIPFISVGDRVNVNYESFPAEKFGYFSGIIDVVTKTPQRRRKCSPTQAHPEIRNQWRFPITR